jgi:hypothetical protein
MCDKLAAHKREVDALSDFFDWLNAQGLELASRHEHTKHCEQPHVHTDGCQAFRSTPCNQKTDRVCGYHEDELQSHRESPHTLIMRWLKIDERKLEDERRAILDHHRKVTGQG